MSVLDTFSLSGKVSVVTGGNRGLGRAFARALGQAGARVAIAARDGGLTRDVRVRDRTGAPRRPPARRRAGRGARDG